MKRILVFLFILTVTNGASALDVSGNFQIDTRFALSNGDIAFNQEYGTLKFESQVDDSLYGMAKFSVRYFNNPLGRNSFNNVLNLTDLGLLYSVEPIEIGLEEAYFTFSDFILGGIDLSVGKQRIQWGTADKLNPTDLLNPSDFFDPFDFGKKRPTLAVNLKAYFPFIDGGVQLVYEPFMGIARLNSHLLDTMQNRIRQNLYDETVKSVTSLATNSVSWANGTIMTPALNWTNGVLGAKLFGTFFGIDLSLSAVHRNNDIPTIRGLATTATTTIPLDIRVDTTVAMSMYTNTAGGPAEFYTNSMVIDNMTTNAQTNMRLDTISYTAEYYRETAIGLDFSTDLGFMLFWGEVAMVIPTEQKTAITMNQTVNSSGNVYTYVVIPTTNYVIIGVATNNMGVTNIYITNTQAISTNLNVATNQETVSLSNEIYFKYTLGMDKSFAGGWYVNFQYNHGFFNERGNNGAERLQDYFLLRLEKSFLSDKLKLALTGVANIDNIYRALTSEDFGNYIANHYGIMGQLSLGYRPSSSVLLEIGVMGLDGKDSTTIGSMRENDLLYTRFEYSF